MSNAPATNQPKRRLPALGYFQVGYSSLACLFLIGLGLWGADQYSGYTVMWMLAGFFGPWLIISFTWVMIQVIRSERNSRRQLKDHSDSARGLPDHPPGQ